MKGILYCVNCDVAPVKKILSDDGLYYCAECKWQLRIVEADKQEGGGK